MMDKKGFHHYFVGLILLLAGFLFVISEGSLVTACLLTSFGLWLCADDLYQHWRQRTEPDYRSPVHRLYGLIYRFKIVQIVNRFVDRIFGKK